MNIDMVKSKINSSIGKSLSFKFNGSRNRVEEFDGVIVDTYPSIFIVRENTSKITKSFSYSDVLICQLIVKKKQK